MWQKMFGPSEVSLSSLFLQNNTMEILTSLYRRTPVQLNTKKQTSYANDASFLNCRRTGISGFHQLVH